MKTPSIPVAFVASLVAAILVVMGTVALPRMHDTRASETPVVTAQAQSGSSVRRDDLQQQLRTRPVDCHRDVRTHRINGVLVRHRHVGDNCEVRVVRQSSEPATGN